MATKNYSNYSKYRTRQEADDRLALLQSQAQTAYDNNKHLLDSQYQYYSDTLNNANSVYSRLNDSGRQYRIINASTKYKDYKASDISSFFNSLRSVMKESDPFGLYHSNSDLDLINKVVSDYNNFKSSNAFSDKELYDRIQSKERKFMDSDYRAFFNMNGDQLVINPFWGINRPAWLVDVLSSSMYGLATDKAYSQYQKGVDDYNQKNSDVKNNFQNETNLINGEFQSKDQSAALSSAMESAGTSVAKNDGVGKNSVPILGGSGFNFGGMILGFNDLLGSIDSNNKLGA